MPKIKLTKGELKRQRDALAQYQRYLPTLQLKKQQLQVEILQQAGAAARKKEEEHKKLTAIEVWAGLLAEEEINLRPLILPRQIISAVKNIAGLDIPVFQGADFAPAEYDLFLTPLWVDAGLKFLREVAGLRAEIRILEQGIAALRRELRVTAQRVNLFEKVKIPEAEENIRLIKIYIGDQMANAVGRSKIAKRKIEELVEVSLAA